MNTRVTNREKVKEPKTISLSKGLRRRIECYAELRDMSFSAAVTQLLLTALDTLPDEVQRQLLMVVNQMRREEYSTRVQAEEAAKIAATAHLVKSCPNCGDHQIIHWPDGRWRCNVCMEEGTE